MAYTKEEQEYLDSLVDLWDSEEYAEFQQELNDQFNSVHNREAFNFYRWSDVPEVDVAIDALCKSFPPDKKKYKPHVLRTVTKITVMNLIHANLIYGDNSWISVPLNKNVVDAPSLYRQTGMSHKYLSYVIHSLKPKYIKFRAGNHGHIVNGKRRLSIRSRIQAKPSLLELFDINPFQITHHEKMPLIILREDGDDRGHKAPLHYEVTDEITRMHEVVASYNKLLSQTEITINNAKKYPDLDFSNKSSVRIFNNGQWTFGGRWWGGWWQSVPRDKRNDITISGIKTVELDFSYLHPYMLYGYEGIELKTDCYSLEEYKDYAEPEKLRTLLKKMLLIWINAGTKRQATYGLKYEILRDASRKLSKVSKYPSKVILPPLKPLIAALLKRNTPIQKYLFTGIGLKLQNKDSQIAEIVIRVMTAGGMPILCLHDGFRCEEHNIGKLRSAMKIAYRSIMHTNPPEIK